MEVWWGGGQGVKVCGQAVCGVVVGCAARQVCVQTSARVCRCGAAGRHGKAGRLSIEYRWVNDEKIIRRMIQPPRSR